MHQQALEYLQENFTKVLGNKVLKTRGITYKMYIYNRNGFFGFHKGVDFLRKS